MSVDHSQPVTSGEDWFQPGTHSLWLYTREGRGEPALVSVYEWESLVYVASLSRVLGATSMSSKLTRQPGT